MRLLFYASAVLSDHFDSLTYASYENDSQALYEIVNIRILENFLFITTFLKLN